MASNFVVVHCDNNSVHCGYIEEQDGKRVRLSQSRNIWRWRGANTLNEVASKGVSMEWSRIAEPVDSITILDARQIYETTSVAENNLTQSRWGK